MEASVTSFMTRASKKPDAMKYRVFPTKCNILERHISAFSDRRNLRKKAFERYFYAVFKKIILYFVTIAVFEQIMMFLNIMDSDHYPASKY